MSKTHSDNMKQIYVEFWTKLKEESIGKKGKDLLDLLIWRSNEYKTVNKDKSKFEQELLQFTEE